MNPFQSLRDYELFVYTLPQQFQNVESSTLVVARRGRLFAEVTGELIFGSGHRLFVYERLVLDTGTVKIEGYSYEAWRGSEKLYWYDSQPHPNDPGLARTHPHHQHIPPDIRHNRIPAPALSFTQTNLQVLVQEIVGIQEAEKISIPLRGEPSVSPHKARRKRTSRK